VREYNCAWHAGRVHEPTWDGLTPGINPNLYTIGIEHEGSGREVWSEPMLSRSAALVVAIARRWRIPIDREHIVGHREIYGLKTCPGALSVDALVAAAEAQRRAAQ
jgi:N-acetyl-anhydromuramyl-L-alanine amidase AmpD